MITDWSQLPLVLNPRHMAELMDVNIATIWNRCKRREMHPAPATWKKPWIWSRESVRRQLDEPAQVSESRYFKRGAAARLLKHA